MVSIGQMRNLIEKTCQLMGHKYASKDAVELVLATGIVESRYEYIRQMGDGPARSFWQVEPASAVDNCQHYLKYRSELMKDCAMASLVNLRYWQIYEEGSSIEECLRNYLNLWKVRLNTGKNIIIRRVGKVILPILSNQLKSG